VRTCAGIRALADADQRRRRRALSQRGQLPVAHRASRLPISAVGQQRAGRPSSSAKAGEQPRCFAAQVGSAGAMAVRVGHVAKGPIQSGRSPPNAIGPQAWRPGAQADQRLHLLVPAAVAIGRSYPAASASPRQAGAEQAHRRAEGAPLTENSAGAPAPTHRPGRAGVSPPAAGAGPNSSLAGWARAAAPASRIARAGRWPGGERPRLLAT